MLADAESAQVTRTQDAIPSLGRLTPWCPPEVT